MSVYLPPTHINRVYNNADYEYQNGNVTLSTTEQRYLSRVGVANSQATLTTFSGLVNTNKGLNITNGGISDTFTSNVYNCYDISLYCGRRQIKVI